MFFKNKFLWNGKIEKLKKNTVQKETTGIKIMWQTDIR
jgi:hypothetical protein